LPIGVIAFDEITSEIKKQMLPPAGENAISPFLNSFRCRSTPELITVSKYTMFCPRKCAFPSSGKDRKIEPTVFGERWRFSSHVIFDLPFTSTIRCELDTEPTLILQILAYEYITVLES